MKESPVDKKIKILFFIDILYAIGGTEKQLLELIKRLDPTRFECYVCPFRYTTYMLDRVRELGAEVWPLRVKRMYGISGIRQAFSILFKIRRNRIDMVSSFHFIADTYGVLLAKLAGVPCIVSNRRDTGDHQHKEHARLIKWLDRFVDHYFAVGRAVAKHIHDDYGIRQNKISVLHNGIDIEATRKVNPASLDGLRKQYSLNGNGFVIGNISHVRPEKGYDVFFEAIRRVKPHIPDLKVFAVGDGLPSEREMVRKLAHERGVSDLVIFTNYVSNPLDYIRLMDIACLTPIRNEGFSNALLEEMTLGKAIVATDVGANAEAIVNGESGLIIPPNNPDELTQAILKYYRDPKLRQRLGQAAVRRVENCFRIEKTIAAVQDMYLSLHRRKSVPLGSSL